MESIKRQHGIQEFHIGKASRDSKEFEKKKDKSVLIRELQKGDWVLSKYFYVGPKCLCGTVKIKTGLLSYVIHLDTGMVTRNNLLMKQLKFGTSQILLLHRSMRIAPISQRIKKIRNLKHHTTKTKHPFRNPSYWWN